MESPFDMVIPDLELGLEFGQGQLFGGQFEDVEVLSPLTDQDPGQGPMLRQWMEEDQMLKANKNDQPNNDVLQKIVNEIQIEDNQELINVASPFQVMPLETMDQSDQIPTMIDCKPSPSACSDAQSLIEEMEEFLNGQNIVQEQVQTDDQTTEEDAKEAERLLDALIKGEVGMEDDQVSNVTEFQTSQDGNVIIVIANDTVCEEAKETDTSSIADISSVASEEESMMDGETSDSDWAPESPKYSKRTRKPTQISIDSGITKRKRGPYNTKGRKNQYNLKDKKERKKMQNVVAARRYRDKKKNEQGQVEQTEAQLTEKNNKLKENLAELEGEVKTLKKLLVELGLVTIKG